MTAESFPYPTTWSFSRWATFDTCPLQYKLKFIHKMQDPPSPAMQRGDVFHKAIAKHITGDHPCPPEIVDPFHKQLVAEMKAFSSKLVEQQWGFSERWQAVGWFGKSTWLRNIADVAMLYEDNSAEVVDWKTGKRYGSNDEQMELGAVTMFQRFRGQTVNGVKTTLIYVDAGGEETAEFKFADLDRLRAKWHERAVKMLEERQFLPRPNDKCKFCNFSRSKGGQCRFG